MCNMAMREIPERKPKGSRTGFYPLGCNMKHTEAKKMARPNWFENLMDGVKPKDEDPLREVPLMCDGGDREINTCEKCGEPITEDDKYYACSEDYMIFHGHIDCPKAKPLTIGESKRILSYVDGLIETINKYREGKLFQCEWCDQHARSGVRNAQRIQLILNDTLPKTEKIPEHVLINDGREANTQ